MDLSKILFFSIWHLVLKFLIFFKIIYCFLNIFLKNFDNNTHKFININYSSCKNYNWYYDIYIIHLATRALCVAKELTWLCCLCPFAFFVNVLRFVILQRKRYRHNFFILYSCFVLVNMCFICIKTRLHKKYVLST